jgi:predicted Zn-dependent protease
VLLAGQLRTAREVDRAIALVDRGSKPERVEEALVRLRRAAERTADTTPLLRAAEMQLFAGRIEGALSDAQEVARREPENARAWLVAVQASARLGDESIRAVARRRLAQLVARP